MILKLVQIAIFCLLPGWLIAQNTQRYYIDRLHSSINFSMNYLEIMEFNGRADDYYGEFHYDSINLNNSHLKIIVNAKSLNTAMPNRDKDLHSEDYMNSETFPAIIFESSKFSKDGDHYLVRGSLTIKNVTKTIELPFSIPAKRKDNRHLIVVKTEPITINRSEFGIGTLSETSIGKIFLGDKIRIWTQVLFKSEFEDEGNLRNQFEEVTLKKEQFDIYAGSYVSEQGTQWFVERFSDMLFFILPSAANFRALTPIGDHRFIVNDIGYTIQFNFDDQNNITGLTYQRGPDQTKWREMKKKNDS